MEKLRKYGPLIRKHHLVKEVDHAYGIMSKHENLTSLIRSFFQTNEDIVYSI